MRKPSTNSTEPDRGRVQNDSRTDYATPTDHANDPQWLWSTKNIMKKLDISRRTLERERAAGRFPPPDKRIGRMPRWKPETIRRWVEGE